MRYLSIGEPLAEFTARPDQPSVFDRRAGGDTLNTAIYLARLTGPGRVGYLSCLGDDAHSLWLRAGMAAEGIDTSALATRAGARPGLSFISTDARGERSFAYWRDQAPFRDMFADPADLAVLDRADTLILSAITLAVLRPAGREALLTALSRRRDQGARVVFDTNYRPALWPDAGAARQAIAQAASIASLLLPSLDDMLGCFGTASAEDAMSRLIGLGAAEVVLTSGGGPVLHRAEGGPGFTSHSLSAPVAALDTTGAGDSFNAAWIAGRDGGLGVAEAVAAAAALAAVVVRHPGAVIPPASMPARLPA